MLGVLVTPPLLLLLLGATADISIVDAMVKLTKKVIVPLIVGQLVRLDRLPKQNPLEGLLLLQEAWKSHDIAVHLADYYKIVSKFLFMLQLVVVWLITFTET